MSTAYQQPQADTLIGAALAPLDWTRSVSLAVVFSLLTALAAQIVIPIGLGAPITAQTFAVLLTGALFNLPISMPGNPTVTGDGWYASTISNFWRHHSGPSTHAETANDRKLRKSRQFFCPPRDTDGTRTMAMP